MSVNYLDIPSPKKTNTKVINTPIIKDLYTPNFVLVEDNKIPFFSDIVVAYPVYKGISKSVIASWSALSEIVWFNRVVLICILSIIKSAWRSSLYHLYLTTESLYTKVQELPQISEDIKKSILDIRQLFTSNQHRDLWWLDTKLNLRILWKKVKIIAQTFQRVVSKFYLLGIVTISLASLQLASLSNSNLQNTSYLSRFLDQNSIVNQTSDELQNNNDSLFGAVDIQASNIEFEWVAEYSSIEGDSALGLATDFNLDINTILTNNDFLDSSDLEKSIPAGSKVIIPWIDGLVFTAKTDLKISEITEKSGADLDQLKDKNNHYFSQNSELLKEGDYLFIPTNEPGQVNQKLVAYEDELIKLKKEQEQAKARARARISLSVARSVSSRSSVYKSTLQELIRRREQGLLIKPMPSYKYVSRCFVGSHRGVDLPAVIGSKVVATDDAIVIAASSSGYNQGYGKFIRLRNSRGDVFTFAHLSRVDVSIGDSVSRGQLIGASGNSGNSTGPHLHYEIHSNGINIDPCNIHNY